MIQHIISPDIPAAAKTRWSGERVARLGFLVGQGLGARHVADDPLIGCSVTNVHRQARRFGLVFRETLLPRLPDPVVDRYDSAASKRGLSRDGLVRKILIAAASDETLIDNILDDGA